MKCTIAILLFACLQVSAKGFSQSRITVKLQSVDMKKALALIERKSDFRFLYNQGLLSNLEKVQLNADNEEVTSVLDRLFENTPLSYQVLPNNLVVLKAKNTVVADVRVTGKVTSPTGEPIPGVTVSVKGSSAGTSTDASGNFTITVPDDATLVFSSVGFELQEVPVNGRTALSVTMKESTGRNMDEVVVIGYGTARKRDLTGSIVKIEGREVADKPNVNPVASLQGKVAGVSIVNSGKPGQEPDIRIRGTISRTQTRPLYVVDGLLNDNINFINPADIESMEILKDASSLAIFGVRGANGVIIVTTKRGRTGRLTVNFNSSVGVKHIVDKVSLTDAPQFKTLYDEQRVNQGQSPYPNFSKYNGNSNWVDLISQNGIVNTNNVSISSGTDKNKFYMSLGYLTEEGVINHERLEKIILSLSDELKVSKALKFGFNLNGSKSKLPQTYDFGNAIRATPIVEPFNQQYGVYNRLPDEIGGPQITNPVMAIEEYKGTDLQDEYRVVGSVFAEISFLKNFTFRSTFYGDLSFADERKYTPIVYTYDADQDTVTLSSNISKVYQQAVQRKKYQQEHLLTYKKDFGNHGLTLLGGFTTNFNDYVETNGEVRQVADGLPIPRDKRFWYVDNFYGDPTTRRTAISHGKDIFNVSERPLQWEQSTVSYLFRALYNYKEKYILNASFRRDGSSEIASKHRFQNFVAVGAAWDIGKEEFFTSQGIFDHAKLKGSWGILGNQFTQIHYPFYPLLASGQSAVFNNGVIPGYVPSFLADPDLQWETVTSKEIGVEFSLLKNRLSMEVNYFNKITDNLLTNFPGLGGQRPGITNAGKIENRGIEASATWNAKVGNFGYSISGNITTLHNKVLELYTKGFEIITGEGRTTAGLPIGSFYGYIQDGIYQSDDEISKSPDAASLGTVHPGDMKFKDLNGDNKVDDKDRTFIGNPTPKFIYGLSLGANYGGLDVSIDLQGVSGNDIFRTWGNGASYAPFNYRTARLARWTGPNTSNFEPVLNDNNAINRLNSTYMIEDGTYLRIRNLQIGYNFPTAMISRAHIKGLRVFLNGQNLKTFKNNSGFTPEFGGNFDDPNASPAISFGVDAGSYPIPAIYSAGVNLTF